MICPLCGYPLTTDYRQRCLRCGIAWESCCDGGEQPPQKPPRPKEVR